MATNLECVEFLKSFACSHLNEEFFEGEGWDMMNYLMQTKGSPIPKIKNLKDKGNNLYKQNCFLAAASCYDEACKLLSLVVGMEDSYDTKVLSELGVSLNLNLAVCALKLCEHEASRDHCSIVLSFFPKNVKALFRRGLTFMKLNKFLEAKSDLEAALLVEPTNKDILRELCVVKNYLAINLNGKRSFEEHPLQEPTENGEVQTHGDEPPLKTLRESSSNSSLSGGSLTQSPKCDMELDSDKFVSDQQSCISVVSPSTSEVSCSFDGCAMAKSKSTDEDGSNSDSKRGFHGADKKMYQFSKKGRGHSIINIDECTYNKLLDGKEVSFFQNFHLSTLKIRVLNPCIKEPDTGSVIPYKKKRKRRKRTKGLRAGTPTTVTDGTKRDVLPLSSVASNKTMDDDMSVEEVTSRPSGDELVGNQALGDPTGGNSYQHPIFIFTSSKPKVAKMFRARRQSRRVQSQREESPRRNVYIYPGKFPRTRDVNVSCCRYSPKAHLLKKRKETTPSSLRYSNNTCKKLRVLSSPTPSLNLSFCTNNVAVAPDLPRPKCSM